MNPLISVIVPIYKVEACLPRCLNSIVNQTYRNLEIILVDDGSPDGCGTICEEYACRDNRIRVIHKENGGVSSARNAGLDIMSGEYTMFVDGDDWIVPDAVQILYRRMLRDGSDMAIGKHTDVYPDGSENNSFCTGMTDAVFTPEEMLSAPETAGTFAVVAWSKLYRRELFENLRYPPLCCGEDCWLYPYLVERCARISSVNQLIYYYFQFEKSLMHVYNHDAQTGNLEADLHMTRFLLGKHYTQAANFWFSKSIDHAWWVEQSRAAVRLLNRYFSEKEQWELLRVQPIKIQMKWVMIHSGTAARLLKAGKKRRGR